MNDEAIVKINKYVVSYNIIEGSICCCLCGGALKVHFNCLFCLSPESRCFTITITVGIFLRKETERKLHIVTIHTRVTFWGEWCPSLGWYLRFTTASSRTTITLLLLSFKINHMTPNVADGIIFIAEATVSSLDSCHLFSHFAQLQLYRKPLRHE